MNCAALSPLWEFLQIFLTWSDLIHFFHCKLAICATFIFVPSLLNVINDLIVFRLCSCCNFSCKSFFFRGSARIKNCPGIKQHFDETHVNSMCYLCWVLKQWCLAVWIPTCSMITSKASVSSTMVTAAASFLIQPVGLSQKDVMLYPWGRWGVHIVGKNFVQVNNTAVSKFKRCHMIWTSLVIKRRRFYCEPG